MPKFIALIESWPACKYSHVGCGKKWIELKSNTSAAALQELRKIIFGPDEDGEPGEYADGDYRLSGAIMLEVNAQQDVPITEWYAQYDREKAIAEKEKEAAEERRLYERLRAKFGGK